MSFNSSKQLLLLTNSDCIRFEFFPFLFSTYPNLREKEKKKKEEEEGEKRKRKLVKKVDTSTIQLVPL